MKKTDKKAKARAHAAKDLKMREDKAKKVKGGLVNSSFKVNTLTFSSNATGIG